MSKLDDLRAQYEAEQKRIVEPLWGLVLAADELAQWASSVREIVRGGSGSYGHDVDSALKQGLSGHETFRNSLARLRGLIRFSLGPRMAGLSAKAREFMESDVAQGIEDQCPMVHGHQMAEQCSACGWKPKPPELVTAGDSSKEGA